MCVMSAFNGKDRASYDLQLNEANVCTLITQLAKQVSHPAVFPNGYPLMAEISADAEVTSNREKAIL